MFYINSMGRLAWPRGKELDRKSLVLGSDDEDVCLMSNYIFLKVHFTII